MSDSETKYVYDLSEADASMRDLLGGKGANVAEMRGIGVPVPDGFIVTTTASVEAMKRGGKLARGVVGSDPGRVGPPGDAGPVAGSATLRGRSSCPFALAPPSRCPE